VLVVGWKAWAIGFAALHCVFGFTLAIVFQPAHVVEHTESDVVSDDPKLIETEWAVHQVKTMANFVIPMGCLITSFPQCHPLWPLVSGL
jgi:linoleoyl-CoA desaturase